jgi:hypothetical protein
VSWDVVVWESHEEIDVVSVVAVLCVVLDVSVFVSVLEHADRINATAAIAGRIAFMISPYQ